MPANARSSAPNFPEDLLHAAAHPDPYPYYVALLAYRPFYREARLGLWVALGAGAVKVVLESPHCRVRPAAEPVPASIAGTSAGNVFGHLVRMNDGARHGTLKPALATITGGFTIERLTALARQSASDCLETTGRDGTGIDRFLHCYPVWVVAQMIGLPQAAAAEAATQVAGFAGCLSPRAEAAAIARGTAAATALLETLARHAGSQAHGGLPMLMERLADLGVTERDATLANLLGLMSQTYEATAGLIGNTLLALAHDDLLRRHSARDGGLLRRVIAEVARHDPPIHNTRRFVAADCVLAGEALNAGDTILVVLAAANRDAAVNPRPQMFDPERRDAACFTFGHGAHACPGRKIAVALAAIGIEALLARGLDFASLIGTMTFAPSANARIPVFGAHNPGALP